MADVARALWEVGEEKGRQQSLLYEAMLASRFGS